jgi:hypothetical protein
VSEQKKKFMKVLAIEIEDLIEDLSLLIETHEKRLARGEITAYVCRENVALLTNGRRALERFREELTRLNPSEYRDVKDMEKAVEKSFTAFLEEHNFTHAVEGFVDRKLRKILEYCECD